MSKSFDQGKEDVDRLCRYFATNHQAFLGRGVKEADIRQSLIDPFFEALGWNVRNTAMIAPQYREVIVEPSLEVEGRPTAPDYAFRVGTLTKFYAEAKNCGSNIHEDPGHARQLRGYGWSAKVALSILTSFEELSVYDCTFEPGKNDRASHARLQYYRYEEYPDRWRELWEVFSREAVWSGAFDEYAASKRKRGTAEVDVAFLKLIEVWRDSLARNIALRNRPSSEDLNAAVQRIIDRVVFLRMAEDRGLEPYKQLLNLCERSDIYARFMRDVCRQADEKYNSGLFHFEKESGIAEPPDRITPKLAIDDRVFKPIIQKLYYDHGSHYHFGVMPVEILGTVYERFLGKVIRLTAGGHAKVEEKPEVRKAGGVYYTPAYIVNFIVRETIGRQIDGKSPMQLAGLRNGKQPFRALDMACGSGSFLLGAYQHLLDHCLAWYLKNKPQSHRKAVYNGVRSGQWRLTIEEKKRILTTHLFGVDIDPQAVEVTKLSLLLKVLEGETDESVMRQMQLFQERALPNLAENIKCGNSLIGPDYFTERVIPDPDELQRVNPFDWKRSFPGAMQAGGFDCIIGNPPWLMAGYYLGDEIDHIREKFRTAEGKFDLYYVFLEAGLRLTNNAGRVGMIVPNKFFHTKAAASLRQFMRDRVESIVDFGDAQVFIGPTNYSCVVTLVSDPMKRVRYQRATVGMKRILQTTVERRNLSSEPWHFEERRTRELFTKMETVAEALETLVTRFGTGVQSGADRFLMVDRGRATDLNLEKEVLRPVLRGRDVRRYALSERPNLLIFPYQVDGGEFSLLSENEIKRKKNAYRLLSQNEDALAARIWFGKGPDELSGGWYGMMYLDRYQAFASPHILTPSLSNRSNFAIGKGDLFATGTAGVTSIIPREDIGEDVRYILGVLNSRLLSLYAIGHSPIFSGAYFKFSAPYLKRLPIRRIDFNKQADTGAHERMVKLVDAMISLRKRLSAAKSTAQSDIIRRQIDATEAEIDRQVYDLYGLTPEEIALVEKAADR